MKLGNPVSKTLVAFIAALAVFVGVSIANGASWTSVSPWLIISGTDGTSPQPVKVDSNGAVNVTTAASGAMTVGGPAADDAAASGNPVPVGCKYNSTVNTVEDGDIGYINCGTRGALHVELWNSDGAAAINSGAQADALSNGASGVYTNGRNNLFNGSTWDRMFTCTSSAPISVAAAATTELVALTASQIIRVCSLVISGDTLATTATFVYGTGTNCATGQAALTGAMRMPDEGSISLSAGNGSLFRTASANALCLTAATGAVTGFVSYAKF